MADVAVATLCIDSDEDGKFWISLEGQDDAERKGPFDTAEEAADAAFPFLQETIAAMAKKALIGD